MLTCQRLCNATVLPGTERSLAETHTHTGKMSDAALLGIKGPGEAFVGREQAEARVGLEQSGHGGLISTPDSTNSQIELKQHSISSAST
jgi:hypothetical protein